MDKLWIVRSHSEIIGPISKDEVQEHLVLNNISSQDEICSSLGEWVFIRDEETFAQFLKSKEFLRGTKNEFEHTQHTYTDILTAENTFEVSNRHYVPTASPAQKLESTPARNFIPFYLLGALVIVVSGGVFFLKNTKVMMPNLNFNIEDVNQKLTSYDYSSAYKMLSSMSAERRQELGIGSLYQTLLLSLSENKELILKEISPEQAQEKFVLGHYLLKTGQFKEAINFYKQKMSDDKYNLEAWAQMGQVYYEMDDAQKALDFYMEAYSRGYKKSWLLLRIFDAHSKVFAIDKDFEKFSYIKEIFIQKLSLSNIFSTELLKRLFSIWPHLEDADKRQIEGFAYDQDFFISDERVVTLDLDHRFEQLSSQVCENNKVQLEESQIYFLCLSLFDEFEKAIAVGARSERLKQNQDSKLQSLMAYNYYKAGLRSQFIISLAKAQESGFMDSSLFSHILQARFCENEKDLKCSLKHWSQVLNRQPHSIVAKIKVSKINDEMGKESEASHSLKKAAEFVEDAEFHRDFLKLQKKYIKSV